MSVEDFLISRDEAWGRAPTPKFDGSCDNLRRYGVYLDSGGTASHPVQCNMWDHQLCAEKHALHELRILQALIGGNGSGYFAKLPTLRFSPARLTDRRYRAAKKVDGPVWYRWYRRDDGTVWVFASHNLGGRKSPSEFTFTENLLRVASVALRLPGVDRADGSSLAGLLLAGDADDDDEAESAPDEERPEDEDDSPKVKWIGVSNSERWEETQKAAAVEVKDRFGIDVNPSHPLTLRGELTVEEWIVALESARRSR